VTVAIVRAAWRTPLGSTIDGAMARLFAGERAITTHAPSSYVCTLAAPIRIAPAPSRQARFLRRMGSFALEVAREAVGEHPHRHRVGLFSGVGGLRAHWDDMMPALANQLDDGSDAWARGLRDVHPYWMLRHLSNNAHALAAAELGLRGEGATFGGATGGAQAIASACRALEDGAVDAALVIAYDSLLEPETLVELGARRAATAATNNPPPAYDDSAAGYVPGEAAAAILLVRDDAPGAMSIAVRDAADGARGEPDATTIARLVRALGIAPIVDGAGATWPDLDRAERLALAATEQVVLERSADDAASHGTQDIALTALSAAMGKLGAATAVVQAIALAECLRRGQVYPVAGLKNPSPGPLSPLRRTVSTDAACAVGISTGAPGLAAAIRVELLR
jgi:3-oxoacyl-(acyl-carrier-protein) synthase